MTVWYYHVMDAFQMALGKKHRFCRDRRVSQKTYIERGLPKKRGLDTMPNNYYVTKY